MNSRTIRDSRAWAAGFFEGEGTVAIRSNRLALYTKLIVCFDSTDKECVDFFQAQWPGSVRVSHTATEKHRTAWQWRRQCLLAEKFLLDILPHVRSARVRAKIALALESQAARYRMNKQRRHRPRIASAEYHAIQAGFRAQMTILNRRGVA